MVFSWNQAALGPGCTSSATEDMIQEAGRGLSPGSPASSASNPEAGTGLERAIKAFLLRVAACSGGCPPGFRERSYKAEKFFSGRPRPFQWREKLTKAENRPGGGQS